MNRRRMGVFVGIAAAAFTTWWFRHRQLTAMSSTAEKGEVIFSNAPMA